MRVLDATHLTRGPERSETIQPARGPDPVRHTVGAVVDSYSQNLEDVVLWRVLRSVDRGTYVDVGAADPEVDSVTKLFYDHGWSGLNVEPVRELAARLRARRRRDVVIEECAGAANGEIVLHTVGATGLSTVDDKAADELRGQGHDVRDVTVAVRRLDAMLAAAGFAERPIHFLKVDVEGSEADVLAGIDFGTWRPWVVVVEATAPRTTRPNYAAWDQLLVGTGYEFCLFDGLNRFYLADEHASLRDALSYPACVFDHPYTTQQHRAALLELRSARKGYDGLEELYRSTVAAYDSIKEEYARADAHYQQLSAAYEGINEAHRSCEAAVSELERQRHSLQTRLGEAESDRDRCRAECAGQRAALEQITSQRDALMASASWRMTAPLRAVLERVRRLG